MTSYQTIIPIVCALLFVAVKPALAEFEVSFVPCAIFDNEKVILNVKTYDGNLLGSNNGRGSVFTVQIKSDDILAEMDRVGICLDVDTEAKSGGFFVVEICVKRLAELGRQGTAYTYRAALFDEAEYASEQRRSINKLLDSAGRSNEAKVEIVDSIERYLGQISVNSMHPRDIDLLANIVEHFRRFPTFDNDEFLSMDLLGNPAPISALHPSDMAVGKIGGFVEVALTGEGTKKRTARRIEMHLAEHYIEYQQIDPGSYFPDIVDDEEQFFRALFGFAVALSGHVDTREGHNPILYQGKSPIRLFFEHCAGLARSDRGNLSQACLTASLDLQQLVKLDRPAISDARIVSSKIGDALYCKTAELDVTAPERTLLTTYYERSECAESERFFLSAKACFHDGG